mmetsp:Transcript_18041/g.42509  ORF Transcript_18041/g.42509 Transcript_18041/m.42509 type:complete len:215 (-) Transcript_18041:415-1059(-)
MLLERQHQRLVIGYALLLGFSRLASLGERTSGGRRCPTLCLCRSSLLSPFPLGSTALALGPPLRCRIRVKGIGGLGRGVRHWRRRCRRGICREVCRGGHSGLGQCCRLRDELRRQLGNWLRWSLRQVGKRTLDGTDSRRFDLRLSLGLRQNSHRGTGGLAGCGCGCRGRANSGDWGGCRCRDWYWRWCCSRRRQRRRDGGRCRGFHRLGKSTCI